MLNEQGAMPEEPVEPKPAATIILLRDGDAGLEVLVLRKASGKHFAAGAMVFPGGKVADEDAAFATARGAENDKFEVLKIAAVREMHEECGIMLARPAGKAEILDAAEVEALGEGEILDLAARAPLDLATDRLVRFAHWITPPYRPKRFDTHFFIAPAPDGQREPKVDGYEIVEARWRRPEDILEDVHDGRLKLVLPTMMNIIKLSRSDSVAKALAAAKRAIINPVTPTRVETENGVELHLPDDSGYGITKVPSEYLRSA